MDRIEPTQIEPTKLVTDEVPFATAIETFPAVEEVDQILVIKEDKQKTGKALFQEETKKEAIEEKKNEDEIKEVVIELPVTEQSSSEEKQVTETVEIKEAGK